MTASVRHSTALLPSHAPVQARSPALLPRPAQGLQKAAPEPAKRLPRHAAASALRLPELGPWQHAVWPAHRLNRQVTSTWTTGHAALDAELPGGGWPSQGLTELLQPPHQHLEWRLLAPALRQHRRGDRSRQAQPPRIALIGAPFEPHLPGLLHEGLSCAQWIRIDAQETQERLWACEQLLRSRSPIVIVCWLPEADAASLRRLQSLAQGAQAPCFIVRPLACREQASPAPLRLTLRMGDAWKLQVQVIKRQGPPMAEPLQWRAQPASLQAIWPLTPQGSLPSLQPQPAQSPLTQRILRRSAASSMAGAQRPGVPSRAGQVVAQGVAHGVAR